MKTRLGVLVVLVVAVLGALLSGGCARQQVRVRYARDGDSCRTDADCRPEPEDEVLRGICSQGACRGVTSIELDD